VEPTASAARRPSGVPRHLGRGVVHCSIPVISRSLSYCLHRSSWSHRSWRRPQLFLRLHLCRNPYPSTCPCAVSVSRVRIQKSRSPAGSGSSTSGLCVRPPYVGTTSHVDSFEIQLPRTSDIATREPASGLAARSDHAIESLGTEFCVITRQVYETSSGRTRRSVMSRGEFIPASHGMPRARASYRGVDDVWSMRRPRSRSPPC
jgi:hypothetical protein